MPHIRELGIIPSFRTGRQAQCRFLRQTYSDRAGYKTQIDPFGPGCFEDVEQSVHADLPGHQRSFTRSRQNGRQGDRSGVVPCWDTSFQADPDPVRSG